MTQELIRKPPDLAADGGSIDYTEILKRTDCEEVLEVLAEGFCQRCRSLLETRLHKFVEERSSKMALSNGGMKMRKEVHPANDDTDPMFHKPKSPRESSISNQMHEDLHLDRQKRQSNSSSHASVNSHRNSVHCSGSDILLNDGLSDKPSAVYNDDLSEEQKEQIRFSKVGRKKDFVHVERANGRSVNILQGLELHTKVFNAEEQKKIVDCVYKLQEKGKKGLLLERTYSKPKKWMPGKGRITLQFGCCYNYAVDKNGNPPGIIRDEEVDPLPPIFKKMIKRMVRWHVLPPSCVPNSCIVNIYDKGDCIPPHIDHHDFVRPFCTVSFLTECNIVFGSNLKIVRPGEFSGPVSIPLPVGSVLILNGNGADVAKHCVPGVPTKRISITFRKMDDSKLPYRFSPDPDLLGIKPLIPSPSTMSLYYESQPRKPLNYDSIGKSPVSGNSKSNCITAAKESEGGKASGIPFAIDKDEFPPLGSSSSSKHYQTNRGAGSKH